MKILTFIILVACLQAWGTGHSQTLDLTLKNTRLEKVFQLIRGQSHYRFIYTKEELEGAWPVSAQLHQATIEEVMNKILADQWLDWSLDGHHVIIKKKKGVRSVSAPTAFADIHGRVTGPDGSPLAGATVTVKGTNKTVVTDENGEFILPNLAPGATLIFQSLGHQLKEYVVVDDKPFSIQLSAAVSQLQELTVSTGYEEVPRERATGSFEKVNNELFNRSVSTHVLERLEGIVPGLVFNKRIGTSNATDISIRGISTLGSNQRPLVIVDNFPYEGNIENINPNDVESITVLKDAAAASIWGARAGNGVIVISTKKARYNQKAKLTVNNNLTIVEEPDLNYIPRFSTADYIELEKYLFARGYYNSAINSTNYPILSPVVEILHQRRSGLISPQDSATQIGSLLSNNVLNDYKKYLYRRAINTQHAINLSGGGQAANYLFSVGYDKNLATLIGDDYSRLSLKSVNQLRPLKNLELSLGVLFTSTHASNNSLGEELRLSSGKTLYPYARLAGDQGEALAVPKDYRTGFVDTVGQGRILDWHYRPLDELKNSDKTRKSIDWLANLGAKWTINPWLSAEVKYQYEKSFLNTHSHYSLATYETRSMINFFTPRGGSTIQSAIPVGGILDKHVTELTSQAIRGQLNFHRVLKGHHEISAIAGAETRELISSSESSRVFGYNDQVLSFSPVRFLTQYPTYFGSSGTIGNPFSLSETLDRFVSFYANASYTFRSRYTASVSGRRDASNLFGTATNNKWKPLWSAGVSWDITKDFVLDPRSVQQLKLRLSYGHNGNVNNARPAVLTLSSANPNNLTGLPVFRVFNPPNPSLRWENMAMLNIGLDFSILNRRLAGSIEYYTKSSTDLIGSLSADITTGYETLIINSANLAGKGIDISLRSENLNGTIRWSTDWLFSFNTNRVKRYLLERYPKDYLGSTVTPLEGEIAYSVISYNWAGLDSTGSPLGYLDGKISKDYRAISRSINSADFIIHGSSRPLYFGTIRNTLSYKRLSLSFSIQYRLGYYFRRPNALSYSSLFSSWDQSGYGEYMKRWREKGDEYSTHVPSMVYPADSRRDNFYSQSAATVEKGDHIRLQDINLGYMWKPGTKKLPFSSIKFYAYINNLGIIWKVTHAKLDPDYGIPRPASFAMGVNIEF